MEGNARIIIVIIVFIIFLGVLYCSQYTFLSGSVLVLSNVDGEYYRVGPINSQQASDTFATININIKKIIGYCVNNPTPEFSSNVKLLLGRYTNKSLVENLTVSKGVTTYTVNKGEYIATCLSDQKEIPKIHDLNTLMFVSIHELAHIGTVTVGHGPEFVNFFRYLLIVADKLNIWKYIDYSKYPQEYCGMTINTLP